VQGSSQGSHPGGVGNATSTGGESYSVRTTGWRPTCEHYPRTADWRDVPRQIKGESDEEYGRRIAPILALRAELLALWAPLDSDACLILDPFAGSGTTLGVAAQLGCRAWGVELKDEYAAMAENRIKRMVAPATARLDVADAAPLFAQKEGRSG